MKSLREMIDIVEGTEDTTQEYTVRVVDSANKVYTVKVTASSEEGAKHKAVVQVRDEYKVRPEGVRILSQDIEEEATPEAVEKINKLYQDKQ